MFTAVAKNGIDTRRTVDRKTLSLTQLYRRRVFALALYLKLTVIKYKIVNS